MNLAGGPITVALIIETQAGDVSAHIPTNVYIHMADGTDFPLKVICFFSGQRQAVNIVGSVGTPTCCSGAAQAKAMKKAAGSLRVDARGIVKWKCLHSSHLTLMKKAKALSLTYGKEAYGAFLKQPLTHPLSLAQQVITLVAAIVGKKLMLMFLSGEIKKYQGEMLEYFENSCILK